MDEGSFWQPLPELAEVFAYPLHEELGDFGCLLLKKPSEWLIGLQPPTYFGKILGPPGAF